MTWGQDLDQRPIPAVQLARCKKNKVNIYPRCLGCSPGLVVWGWIKFCFVIVHKWVCWQVVVLCFSVGAFQMNVHGSGKACQEMTSVVFPGAQAATLRRDQLRLLKAVDAQLFADGQRHLAVQDWAKHGGCNFVFLGDARAHWVLMRPANHNTVFFPVWSPDQCIQYKSMTALTVLLEVTSLQSTAPVIRKGFSRSRWPWWSTILMFLAMFFLAFEMPYHKPRNLLGEEETSMCLWLASGWPPQMKVRDLRASNRGGLSLGLV